MEERQKFQEAENKSRRLETKVWMLVLHPFPVIFKGFRSENP